MRIAHPTPLKTKETVFLKTVDGAPLRVVYDHDTDNYEITLNGHWAWDSNGRNDHDLAESVLDAILFALTFKQGLEVE